MDELLKYWPIITSLAAVLAAWAAWSVKRAVPSHDDLKRLGDAMSALESGIESSIERNPKIVRLEETVKRAPTHDDLARLYQRLDDLNGNVRGLSAQVGAVSRSVEMVHQYLLKNGGES